LNCPAAQRFFHRWRWTFLLVLLLELPCGGQDAGQYSKQPVQELSGQQATDLIFPGAAETDSLEEEKRLRALNADRQKRMVADADKLLKLATELNAEVSRANSASLTPDQLRKVEEIEKLAHSVKQKMATSVRGTPELVHPFPPVYQ
jgi:hypothetical protein